ncbi:hypothetical protein QWZ13_08125 [Reinekea marina]|nr:hypothetical protein [Reinekea marina]MDN3648876.1 hypothetical protein [Reinekea marina]
MPNDAQGRCLFVEMRTLENGLRIYLYTLSYLSTTFLKQKANMGAFVLLLGLLSFASAEETANDKAFEIIAMPYPPFVYADNTEKGYSSSLIIKILSGFQQPFHFYIAPPARAQIRASEGQHLITFLPPVENHSDHVRYEELEKSLHYKLFQRSPAQFNWKDLKSKSIGYLNLNSGSAYLDAFNEAGADVTIIPNFTSGLKMLMAERLDFIVGIDLSIIEVAKELGIENEIIADTAALSSFSMLSFYVNKKHPLAEALDAYLKKQSVVKLVAVPL